jgi:hypothetical protein
MRMTVVSFAENGQISPNFIVANFRRFVKRKIAFFLKYCSIIPGKDNKPRGRNALAFGGVL